MDGNQLVTIGANASSYTNASASLTVIDDDGPFIRPWWQFRKIDAIAKILWNANYVAATVLQLETSRNLSFEEVILQ